MSSMDDNTASFPLGLHGQMDLSSSVPLQMETPGQTPTAVDFTSSSACQQISSEPSLILPNNNTSSSELSTLGDSASSSCSEQSASERSTPLNENSSSSELSTPVMPRSERCVEEQFSRFSSTNNNFIAIIGGLGYIGSHTSLELMKEGYNLIIIDNLSNSYASVFNRIQALARQHCKSQCRPMPQMLFQEADYRDEAVMRKLLDQYVVHDSTESPDPSKPSGKSSRIEGVIHFAGYKSVEESIQEPLKYYNNNVAGLINFCSILRSYNVKKFIFSSSATVYGSVSNGLPLKEEYCVHHPESFIDHDGQYKTTLAGCTGITNPYGRSKWMCEAILTDVAFADPEWTILALRYFNPVGCDESGLLGEDPRSIPTNLMPIVVKVITGVSPVLDVYGTDYPTPDGSAVRDYIHVTDLARGHVAALAAAINRRSQTGFRTYNLGSGRGNSVFEIVSAMEAASSARIPLNPTERREGDVGICVAMATRADIELNWKTEKTIDVCCRDIFNGFKVSKAMGMMGIM